jgi:hypothetical protein
MAAVISGVVHNKYFGARRVRDIAAGGIIGETGTIGVSDGGRILRLYWLIANKVLVWV